ncbi:MAG: CheY-like superfamily [Benjaminiella poitrasii]|nr:MAG: CheY-like superfamily [Benjaminiella poitrasii]
MDYFTFKNKRKPLKPSITSDNSADSSSAVYIHDVGKSPSRPTCILYPSSIFRPEEEEGLFNMSHLSSSLPSPPISIPSLKIIPPPTQSASQIYNNKRRFSTPPHSLSCPRLHVLLVDDNPINLQILSRLLTLHLPDIIKQVELVKSGVRALEILKCRPFDLILMDIDMPIMNGLETTQHIRSSVEFDILPQNRKVPIVAVTTNDSPSWRQTFTDAGMNGCIGKPISVMELKKTLQTVLSLPFPVPPFTPD